MGAGCYYTHKCNRNVACWVTLEDNTEDNYVYEDIKNILLLELGYRENNRRNYSNGLFEVILDSTYDGRGIIIYLEPIAEEHENNYRLALANHERSEKRILKSLIKAGYKVRFATSGYTSAEYKI